MPSKQPTEWNQLIMKNNIDKILPATGDLSELDKMKRYVSEDAAAEQSMSDFMDMKYEIALEKFLENNPDKTEEDFISAIRRIPMETGGKVIDFAKYAKTDDSKIRELDLASLFTPGKTLASLTKDERDVVNNLLRMTLGNKD